MNTIETKPCFSSPEVLPEQFIPDHVFMYLRTGAVSCFDGSKSYDFSSGDYCFARKNRLARYTIRKENGEFKRTIFCFEESFLKTFEEKHGRQPEKFNGNDTFVSIRRSALITGFIRSIDAYTDDNVNLTRSLKILNTRNCCLFS